MWLGASVSKLKEKIKSEIQHNFDSIDANNLRLFNVDMPTVLFSRQIHKERS